MQYALFDVGQRKILLDASEFFFAEGLAEKTGEGVVRFQ